MTAAAASQRSVFDAPLLGCRREAGPKLYIPIDARKKMERLADDKPQRAASALKGTMTVPPHHLLLATGSPKASQSRGLPQLQRAQGRCTTSPAKRAGVTPAEEEITRGGISGSAYAPPFVGSGDDK